MNVFFETLAILVLFFLFWGEPDVWDALHSRAMQYAEPMDCKYSKD